MADPIVIPLSAGQVAVFTNLSQQESEAAKALDRLPAARNTAAMMIALEHHTLDEVQGVGIQINLDARTLTFTPNVPTGPQAVE